MARIVKNGVTYSDSRLFNIVTTASNGLAPQLPSSGNTTKYLRADGTWDTPDNTTYGAPTTASSGLVPVLEVNAGGQTSKYLKADGTWAVPTNTTYGTATTAANGLMSASDKTTLNNVASTYVPLNGGTMTGNLLVKKNDAISSVDVGVGSGESDYGRVVLRRSGYYMTVDAATLSTNRQIHFMNLNGSVRIVSNNFGATVTAEKSGNVWETWKSMLNRLRDDYLDDTLSRYMILRFNNFDGVSQLMFHCVRYVNQTTSIWTAAHCNSSEERTYYLSYGSSDACALRKVVKTTSGTITIEDKGGEAAKYSTGTPPEDVAAVVTIL